MNEKNFTRLIFYFTQFTVVTKRLYKNTFEMNDDFFEKTTKTLISLLTTSLWILDWDL